MNNSAGKSWTAEQEEAILSRGCNLLVAAAAGAGKTAVLVERILSRIKDEENPVDIDRLLVVTYTNAAAAEMRDRIASSISSLISGQAGGGRIALQLTLLNRAKITTIHSFCLDILKKFFYTIGLDPGFRIADETEAMMLKSDVLEELFETSYAGEWAREFTNLVECYGGERDDSGLQDLVLRIYDFSRSNPDPDLWLEKMAARYQSAAAPGSHPELYAREVLSEVALALEGAVGDMEAALKICMMPGGPAGYSGGIKDDIAMLHHLSDSCRAGWDDTFEAFSRLKFGSLKKAGAGVDDNLKKQVADIRDGVKKRIKSIREQQLSRPLAHHISDMERLAPLIKSLAGLVSLFADNYRAAKASRGLVDFSDLEHLCLQVLAERDGRGGLRLTPAALEVRQQFEEVLVDEYQDINPVQEAIITMVSRPREQNPNLFMVGDVKQSIYRFRLAEPRLFLEKYIGYPTTAGGSCKRINLSKNFRSRREVLEAVNYVFGRIMSLSTGEIDYDSGASLVCGSVVYGGGQSAPDADYQVELHLLDRSGGGDDPAADGHNPGEEPGDHLSGEESLENEDLAPIQAEARVIARRIREMMAEGFLVYDSDLKTTRPVAYRDVVVLMRSVRSVTNVLIDELNSLGIPACADTGTGYFESAEIETMVSLLKVIDNPRQDIPLASVLRSPVCGLDAGEMAQMRLARKEGDLWDSVVAAARQSGPDLSRKLSRFTESLDRWRELARRATMTDLIWTIYRETGYYHYAGAMPGGALRQANLRALHDRAGQYEATTFRGLFSFLRFIDRLREKGEDQGRAQTLGENQDVVRIMSIHRSKGLEFPVVAVAGLGKKFNLQDLNKDVLLHRELGFGPNLVDTGLRIHYPTLARMAIRERLRREALAEEMRILYVAMTRAREKLILTGTVANLDRAVRNWSRNPEGSLSPAAIISSRCHLDWICRAMSGHRDGGPLRAQPAAPEYSDGAMGSKSRWQVHTATIQDQAVFTAGGENGLTAGPMVEKVRQGEPVPTTGEYSVTVNERLSWQYPAREVPGKTVKISVTGLGEKAGHRPPKEDGEYPSEFSYLKPTYLRPVFLSDRKDLTAAEKGSAVHIVMRHLDLREKFDRQSLAGQVARMLERELLTPDQAASVDLDKIEAFFRSDLGKRLIKADEVKREIPFSLTVPAEEIYPELKENCPGERVIVQGVIDCLAAEGDGYIIIDYKTDRADSAGPAALPEKYVSQMAWYARAVEGITGRGVKGKFIYMFETGKWYGL